MSKKFFLKTILFPALLITIFFVVQNKTESRVVPSDASEIKKSVRVYEDGLTFEFTSREEKTVEEFLAAEQISFTEHDLVLPEPSAPLTPGSMIILERARAGVIAVDGEKKKIISRAHTVEEMLMEAGIYLEEDDIIWPERNALVTNDFEVIITRVEIKEEVVEKVLAFTTKTEEDDALSWRTKKVKVKGEKGIRAIQYRVSYHDGKEVGRKQIASVITKEPVTEVVVQGTHVKVGKKHEGLGTWYAHTGTLAAASPWLPMGSYARVTNEANGKSVIVVINDRGPFGPNRIIDLDKVAFQEIASIGAGIINVKVEEITN